MTTDKTTTLTFRIEPELNLEKSVESRKSTQHLDAPDKIKYTLFTNQVMTVFLISPGTSTCYPSFSRSTDFSRLKEALRTAAQHEHRSIANMVAVMIRDHPERNGIVIEKLQGKMTNDANC